MKEYVGSCMDALPLTTDRFAFNNAGRFLSRILVQQATCAGPTQLIRETALDWGLLSPATVMHGSMPNYGLNKGWAGTLEGAAESGAKVGEAKLHSDVTVGVQNLLNYDIYTLGME